MTEIPTGVRNYVQTYTLRPIGLTKERSLAEWFSECAEQLRAADNLPDNWDSYGGYAANSLSLRHAYNLLFRLAKTVSVLQPMIALNSSGFICFEWDTGEWLMTVEINHRGLASYYYQEGDCEEEGEDREIGVYGTIIQLLTRQ